MKYPVMINDLGDKKQLAEDTNQWDGMKVRRFIRACQKAMDVYKGPGVRYFCIEGQIEKDSKTKTKRVHGIRTTFVLKVQA